MYIYAYAVVHLKGLHVEFWRMWLKCLACIGNYISTSTVRNFVVIHATVMASLRKDYQLVFTSAQCHL